MGAAKFQAQLKTMGVETELDECRRIIDIYRKTNPHIVGLWREAQFALHLMADNINGTLGKPGVLEIIGKHKAIKLPSKLMMRYDELSAGDGDEFTYKTRKGQIKIYGGKVIENVCQAIARCIIGEQMTRIAKEYRVVLTVHDAIACIAPVTEQYRARDYVEECMRWVPYWAQGLPINCESGIGESYGDC